MKNAIEQILFEHSYEVHEEQDHLLIEDEDNKSTTAILYFIFSLLMMTIGAVYFIWLTIAGAILLIYAIQKELNMTPRHIVFWYEKHEVELSYNFLGKRFYSYDRIGEFFATGKKETNLSSPFRDGNKTFGYEIYLRFKSGKEKRLLTIEFHEAHDKDMQELAFALNELTGTN